MVHTGEFWYFIFRWDGMGVQIVNPNFNISNFDSLGDGYVQVSEP